MNTIILPSTSPEVFDTAVKILRNGGLVAYPTDTVYGLAALMTDSKAIDRIYQAKERSPNKAIAILIGDLEQIDLVAEALPASAVRLTQRFWPGAMTLVVPKRPDLPDNLSPEATIGVRMPDHAFARELLRRVGPLATTSANLSGGANPKNAKEVLEHLDGRIELVIDGGDAAGGVPSTVVDCTGEILRILREGAIASADILSDSSTFL
jgi:L-threonylcarbamoyladenylate synthase